MKTYTYDNSFDKKEPVCIRWQETKTVMPEHMHEFIEIVYIVSGTGTHFVNSSEYNVKPGSCVIATTGDVHSFSGNISYYNVFFLPGFMETNIVSDNSAFPILALSAFSDLQSTVSEKNALINFSEGQQEKIVGILSSLFEEYNGNTSGRETAVQCYAMLFLNEIYRMLTLGEKSDLESEFTMPEILEYINTHYNEKLTLSELAQRCYYHPKYFSRIFKKFYGTTVSGYIQELRLKRGKYLLANTDMPVDAVAREIGYSDNILFYKYFKKAFGVSPGEYRKTVNSPCHFYNP